jgi:rubrerythrin
MAITVEELHRNFACASLGLIAYRAWAAQARRERRFNVARLFEALSAARVARAEHAFRELGEVGATTTNVERALSGLEPEALAFGRVTGTTPLSRDLLSRAQRAVSEGRDLRADEISNIYVCGTCGELREGSTCIGACPACGTVPEAHKAFKAIEAMGTLGPHAIVHYLEHTEEGLRKLFDGLDDLILARRPAPDKPSLKELAGHLADVDAVFRERAWLLLETDRPELPPAHPPRLDAAVVYRTMPIQAILEAFHASRKQTLNLLRGLTSAAWHRPGHHELYGDVNLLHQGNWVISHERGHLIDMAQLRHDLLIGDASHYESAELAEVVVDDVNEGE